MHSSHLEVVKCYWDNDLSDDMGIEEVYIEAAIEGMPWFPYISSEYDQITGSSASFLAHHGVYARMWKEQQDEFARWIGQAMLTMNREQIIESVDDAIVDSTEPRGPDSHGEVNVYKFFRLLRDSLKKSQDPKLKSWVREIIEHHGHPGEVDEVLDGWYDGLTEVLFGGEL